MPSVQLFPELGNKNLGRMSKRVKTEEPAFGELNVTQGGRKVRNGLFLVYID